MMSLARASATAPFSRTAAKPSTPCSGSCREGGVEDETTEEKYGWRRHKSKVRSDVRFPPFVPVSTLPCTFRKQAQLKKRFMNQKDSYVFITSRSSCTKIAFAPSNQASFRWQMCWWFSERITSTSDKMSSTSDSFSSA